MARIPKALALAGVLFAASGAAYPMKRDKVVVWETITDVVWTTVEVTTTVTLPPAPVTTAIITPASNAPQTVTATVVPAQPSQKPSEPADIPSVTVPTPSVAPEQPTTNSPAPTTSVVPSPPLSTAIPPPEEPSSTTSTPSAPTSTSGGGGGGHHPVPPSTGYSGPCSETNHCTGEVTYYDTATLATHPGSCGGTSNGRAENVLALPQALMDQADCGRTVTVRHGGNTATGVVVDKCMGCDSTSIDLSRHFFAQIADLAEGRIGGVEWWIH
ncbi:Allergen Asp [Aspergillus sp. HF37]|nr:Allergen Asp [Aspergillus sp. HF37]